MNTRPGRKLIVPFPTLAYVELVRLQMMPLAATRAIHHGYDASAHQGALQPPMFLSSTFCFDSAEQGGARFAGEAPGFIYSRLGNPTTALLEDRMASLEGGEACVASASGMSAIASVRRSYDPAMNC